MPNKNKVFTICGLPGGGTSAISNIFYQLGLPMDNGKYVENHNEDIEIREAIIKDNWNEFKKLVNIRNNKYKNWGWKYPNTWKKLDKIKEIIPDLKIVYVLRDPWACSETLVRRHIKHQRELDKKPIDYLTIKLNTLRMLCKTIKSETNPFIVVSYEKIIRDTENQVKRIADFLELKDPDIKSAIKVIGISDEYKFANKKQIKRMYEANI